LKDTRKINRYAHSLINTSNSNNLNETINSLISFKEMLKKFPDLRYLISTKKVSTDNKLKSIRNIFSKYFNDISMEFILLVISNNDYSIYNDILTKIVMLKEADTKTRKINITSHKEYTSDDRSDILLALKNKFNFDDTSEANFSVDSNIMGGIKVRIGNKIIDGSVATKLKKIKQSLLGI
tara:strand:+ start:11717 stop:12259 length:543 start_codon:yes stop_codon:yes gene_type:complete